MNEPTGFEHETPVRIASTSATERSGFRKCRRQWFLQVVHRLDPQEGNVHLFLGTVYHAALEAFYRSQKSSLPGDLCEQEAIGAYQARFDLELAKIKAQLGFLFGVGEPAFREAGELGLEMLQNYLAKEQNDPLLDEVIAVESRVNVPIRGATGRRIGTLSVQADVVGMRDGDLCVVDHKTASREMSSAHLDLDDQLTAEVYSWWKATGNFPDKAVYNVSYKKTVGPPKVLKSGKLSKDKNQGTTYQLYREEIARLGLPVGDYVDILTLLQEREASDEDPLFRREAVFRTPGQMIAFERDLREEYRDMRLVALHPERAYPNPTSMNCGGCPVRTICTTIQDEGNVEAIIKARYVVADPRR